MNKCPFILMSCSLRNLTSYRKKNIFYLLENKNINCNGLNNKVCPFRHHSRFSYLKSVKKEKNNDLKDKKNCTIRIQRIYKRVKE